MSGNGNQVPLAPTQRGPGPYPRASTPHRPVECYPPPGPSGTSYLPKTCSGQQIPQAPLRVQQPPQSSTSQTTQQEIIKSCISGGHYVSQNQNQTQPRQQQQYPNFQYRATQHSQRPNSHPRYEPQQQFIPGAAASTGSVIPYSIVYPPMSLQTYQHPRSNPPYHYSYVGYLPSYNAPSGPTPQYYYTPNSPQLPTPTPSSNTTGRANPTTMVGPQGTSVTSTAPTVSLPHPSASIHIHQTMPGMRPAVPKRSHRVPIIDPDTRQEILSDLYTDNNYNAETSDRQTPQPDHRIVEEFTRMVNKVANQPTCDNTTKSNFISKNIETPISSMPNTVQPHINAINTININNNIAKSEIFNINEKNLGPDVAVESYETPIVSAISDSPVIVPKMSINVKQFQKSSEQNIQSIILDTNKNVTHKQNKNKNVPQTDELEKSCISSIVVTTVAPVMTVAPSQMVGSTASMSVAVTTTTAVSTVTTAAPVHIPSSSPAPASLGPAQLMAVQTSSTSTLVSPFSPLPPPQPQRIREPKESTPVLNRPNGPVVNAVDNLPEQSINVNPSTSQYHNKLLTDEAVSSIQSLTLKQSLIPSADLTQPSLVEKRVDIVNPQLTATELLSASIEKIAKEQPLPKSDSTETKEVSKTIEAQAKLTQSLASALRITQPEFKMKDINLKSKTTDPDTANGNPTDSNKTKTEDINKNEKVVKNTKNTNKKSAIKMSNEYNVKVTESLENGKDETDKINVEQDKIAPELVIDDKPESPMPETTQPPVFVPKYKYNDDQWSPLNKSGRKCYDLGLLKQIKDDPLSKVKPNVPSLEACNIIRKDPLQDPLPMASISRPMNDSLFPPFVKNASMGARTNLPRDTKKDSRNMSASNKGSLPHKVINISLREDVKLRESDSAWKPTRFRKDANSEDDSQTQELYKKFRGILNKLTPQKFDTLLDKVKTLEINNQKRLEGVIDLVFEKAIDEPNFSEAYAAMCNKLSMLKVPADNATSPEHYVNFRALIINKCQNQFETDKVDEHILKLEKELSECTDPVKKKECQLMLEEENRKVRMRSVGNVRFIGELYKLKMLTSKIMDYCMKYLIDKLEEEKLECLCKLLTTIGEQIENEMNGQLDNIFKKMQDIVDRKSNKISSRVRFMIQDVIELRRRKWVTKSFVDVQPKKMDQIQKEEEQHQRNVELMNAAPMGGFRRDDGGRGKRDGRRQNSGNSFMDNTWKTPKTNFPVDTSKLKAVQAPKNLNNIKLAPHNSLWNYGSGTKNTAQAASNSMISISKNMYSVLENVQADPATLRTNRDTTPNYSKGASIERSTFNSRGDFTSGSGNRSGSVNVARSISTTSSSSAQNAPGEAGTAPHAATIPQEPLPAKTGSYIKDLIDGYLRQPDDDKNVLEVKEHFPPQYHSSLVNEILKSAIDQTPKNVALIAKGLSHLISTNTISSEYFISGIKETFEFASDLYIDIPMLYEYLGKFTVPSIEKQHITLEQVFTLSDTIIASDHGHLLLKVIIKDLNDSLGATTVKSMWQKSRLQLKQWMKEDQVAEFVEDNMFEFLEDDITMSDDTKKLISPAQTQSKLLQLMNTEDSAYIKTWAQDTFGKASNEDWFMRSLIQAICEHALFGSEGRDVPHFNQERMNKFASLIHEFGETKQSREASCLFGIQKLIHRLEHPQGLTLEIFQYLHEQYYISLDGFLAWEESDQEPEGKGVMLKALTSFFTNIKEADNEDSCSED